MRKLRIATFVTSVFTAPPPENVIYAPIAIAIEIAKGLAQKGHDVNFFAPEGSHIPHTNLITAKLKPFHMKYPSDPDIYQAKDITYADREKIVSLWDQRLCAEVFKINQEKPFDIIHSHTPDRSLPFALLTKTPTVYTLHTPVFSWHKKIFPLFASKNQYFVSLSDAQRRPAPKFNWIESIPNGVDLSLFPFQNKPKSDAFLFIGRIIAAKGTHEAIEAAKLSGSKLNIVGPGPTSPDAKNPRMSYWNEKIKPFLNESIRYLGIVPANETYKYYQNAKATLIPIRWEEPFGLTMIESMACGTPVIAFRHGSVQEIVVDGVTGYIVDTVEEMARAMKKIDKIDRKACREHVEKNFSLEKMVDNYEKLFLKLTNRG